MLSCCLKSNPLEKTLFTEQNMPTSSGSTGSPRPKLFAKHDPTPTLYMTVPYVEGAPRDWVWTYLIYSAAMILVPERLNVFSMAVNCEWA